MERVWTGNAKRLSQVDRLRIERLTRAGETFATTAAMVGCSTKSIQRYLATTGGLKSRIKERSPRRLSLADREELSRGLVAGDSLRVIAGRLRRAPSTISRELAWNGSRDDYRAWRADSAALERGRRPKPTKLSQDSRLRREVELGLRSWWSPQQIAAELIREYPDDPSMRVSHETIYKTLFVQARGALRKELTACLRTGRTQRRPHMRTEKVGQGTTTEHGHDQRASCRSRGSSRSGTLGGRPDHRKRWWVGGGDAGGAREPLPNALPSAERPKRGTSSGSPNSEDFQTAR